MNEKSVLVIDTPISCAVCPIFQDGLDGYCPVALSSPYNKYNKRDKHCPLKPLPSEYCTNENTDRWFYGYNRAIRDITGETECPRKN